MKGVSGDTDARDVNVFITIFQAFPGSAGITAERKG